MKKIRVGINGFGRIGRAFLKIARTRPELEIVVVNDLGDVHNLAYLLKYDTVYGAADFSVEAHDGENARLIIDDKEIKFLSEKDPVLLPWKSLGIDVVVEATGAFASF